MLPSPAAGTLPFQNRRVTAKYARLYPDHFRGPIGPHPILRRFPIPPKIFTEMIRAAHGLRQWGSQTKLSVDASSVRPSGSKADWFEIPGIAIRRLRLANRRSVTGQAFLGRDSERSINQCV